MRTFPAVLLLAVTPFLLPPHRAAAEGKVSVARPPALVEIDRRIRTEFWDPELKGIDWNGAVESAATDLAAASGDADRDAAYDRLLARLNDSHTFRVPAGRLPETRWASAGLRIGQDGAGYAVKAVLPGAAAERAGLRLGDRIVSIGGKTYGAARTDFKGLFLALEGPPRSSVDVAWETEAGERRSSVLTLEPEPPGDSLVWRSARVLRRGGHAFGYARLWGISTEVALAVVDLLSDRTESAAAKPELAGLARIDGFLLDVRGNSGGYDPGILSTFLRGRWSSGDYRVRSRGKSRTVPPEYRPLPVALLVNSGTASSGEALALKFRRHGIGPIVGEETAGMLSGGAAVAALPDGSSLWFSARAIEDADGRSYEGRGLSPDIVVADRPGKAAGQEDAVVEAAIQALEGRLKR
ncbi:MAG: S41 family peptidase [Acidobacteriota bacterium]